MSSKVSRRNGPRDQVSAAKKRKNVNPSPSSEGKKQKPGSQARDDELERQLNKLTGAILHMGAKGEDPTKAVSDLFSQMDGKWLRYAFRHDLARSMQCCFRFGSVDMKNSILSALDGKMLELAKSVYSSKTVIAFLRYGDEKQRVAVLNEFRNHMIGLSTHNCGSTVLDFAYGGSMVERSITKREGKTSADSKQKNNQARSVVSVKRVLGKLLLELYGPDFILFDDAKISEPSEIFKELDVTKRRRALEKLSRIVTKQAEKGIMRFQFAHTLARSLISLCEFSLSSLEKIEEDASLPEEKTIQSLVPLVAEACLAMIHSADGAACVARCIAHASAKDRKKFVKILKGHCAELLFHDYGYIVLAALVSFVDDTILLKKTLLPEIITEDALNTFTSFMLENNQVAGSQSRVVFLQMLAPTESSRYLTEQEQLLLKPVPGKSKKEPTMRAKELTDLLAEALIEALKGKLSKLLSVPRSCDVVVESIRATLAPALLDEIADCFKVENLEDATAHRALKRILSNKFIGDTDTNDGFYEKIISNLTISLPEIVKINRACFVLVAAVEHPKLGPTMTSLLVTHKKALESHSSPGAKVLLKMLCK